MNGIIGMTDLALETPLAPVAAIERARRWFSREHVLVLDPGPRHLQIMEGLVRATGVGGDLTTLQPGMILVRSVIL